MDWKDINKELPPLNTYVLIHYVGENWHDSDDDPTFKIAKFKENAFYHPTLNNSKYIFREFGPESIEIHEVDYWCEFDKNLPTKGC